jgi:putative holliday junction resolvase
MTHTQNNKIVALDLGDQWIGSAISDALQLLAQPFKTVPVKDLGSFLHSLMSEQITTIVVGYPLTLKGTESLQTKKIVATKQELSLAFPTLNFVLWDERLTSQQAQNLKHARTKEEKLKSHSIAAAFILQSYLDFLYQQRMYQSQSDT